MAGPRKDLLAKARNLRREMTKEERHLWYDFLCRYPVRFRRQRPMLDYIMDFYCPKVQLGVELDGGQHASGEQLEYDMERTHRLSKMGIFILRFTNREIWQNFSGVCQMIDRTVEDRLCSRFPEGSVH
ncbi:endonuclease domain-containing protein [Mitsuokella sp.]|uniref:endonuclease domain-containing protein n=1 Tax=Mitsuokella sp. TaxID=2049034 RepID=UPI002A80BE8E|nr:endonuclease domain-containing protein [Mitsuokella sp.]MDY4474554.1 endonuclease domain-containing protein [Mitsuokella sp.]